MSTKEIQQKFYQRLQTSGWGDVLKSFIMSDTFSKLLVTLDQQATKGLVFTPEPAEIFRAFEECPYKDLRVVIIGQDPYPQAGVADGIAFSCSKTMKAQPSLTHILEEVAHTVYFFEDYSRDPDLKRWSNQGILLLNTALTCQVDKIGSHVKLWETFITTLLKRLNEQTGLCFVFLGKKAEKFHDLIGNHHYRFFTTHPAYASYQGIRWDSGDLFNNINAVLQKLNGQQIQW